MPSQTSQRWEKRIFAILKCVFFLNYEPVFNSIRSRGFEMRRVIFVYQRVLVLFLVSSVVMVSTVLAQQAGTITRINGSVEIFTDPSSSLRPGKVKFEGKYFKLKKAKIGDEIQKGNIIRTAPNSKAKVVFDNGDQINVGPGSSYQVDWNQNSQNAEVAQPQINLKYGKIRSVISKKGPRKKLRIRTRSATMGVRGTDFYVSDVVSEGGTRVSVIRGKVKLQPKTPQAPPVEVKNGFTADVVKEAKEKSTIGKTPGGKEVDFRPKSIKLRKTTKLEVVKIHKDSVQKAEALKKQDLASEQAEKKVKALEQKAIKTTLEDIKENDPKLYAKVRLKKVDDVQMIDAEVMKEKFKAAPKGPTKPFLSELEGLDENAYENYFNVD